MTVLIRPQPLTAEAFAGFGDVLECGRGEGRPINQGRTLKFAALAAVLAEDGGATGFSGYRSQPVNLPFILRELERHPRSSQAFIPLHSRPFPVVVALPVDRPGPDDIRAFLTNGRQGVSLHPGTWHHHQLSLEEISDYLVVERQDDADDLELCTVAGEAVLQF